MLSPDKPVNEDMVMAWVEEERAIATDIPSQFSELACTSFVNGFEVVYFVQVLYHSGSFSITRCWSSTMTLGSTWF